jgi:hypothetical protein
MPWVRYDDGYPDHPKIVALPDRLYRLHNTAICWAARHTTDGVIRAHLLAEIRLKPRPRPGDAAKLVDAGLLHRAGDPGCGSQYCPPAGPDGWVIHDYWGYQPRRLQVEKDRRDRADRQARWRDKRRNSNASTPDQRNGPVDPLRNGTVDAPPYPPPPRPAPKEAGGGAPRSGPSGPETPPAASSAGGAAGGVEDQHTPAGDWPTDDPGAIAADIAAADQARRTAHAQLAASARRGASAARAAIRQPAPGNRREQDALAELRAATPAVPTPAEPEPDRKDPP